MTELYIGGHIHSRYNGSPALWFITDLSTSDIELTLNLFYGREIRMRMSLAVFARFMLKEV